MSAKRTIVDLSVDDDGEDGEQNGAKCRAVAATPQAAPPLPAFRLLRGRDEPTASHLVTLSELTAGDAWECVILSNYLICEHWLLSACPVLRRTPTVVITTEPLSPWHERVQIFKPRLFDKYGVNHSKFFVLLAPAGVRVIVHTANLLYHDVEHMTQGVWSQDFPRKALVPGCPPTCEFEEKLVAYLNATGWEGGGKAGGVSSLSLREFDFSRAAAHLLGSVPGRHGRHEKKERDYWGHQQLSVALRRERLQHGTAALPASADDELVLQFSSLSSSGRSAKQHLLDELVDSMWGHAGGRPGRVRVVWPTVDEVRLSKIGFGSGTSMPSASNHVSDVHRRQVMHRWVSAGADGPSAAGAAGQLGRARTMPHIKSYVRWSPGSGRIVWAALTSANYSMAAWGKLENNSSQLYIKNFELGVLVTPGALARAGAAVRAWNCLAPDARCAVPAVVRAAKGAGAEAEEAPDATAEPPALVPLGSAAGAAVQGGVVSLPLPYCLPPTPYAAGDRPWSARDDVGQAIVYSPPDHLGHTTVGHIKLHGVDKEGRVVARATLS